MKRLAWMAPLVLLAPWAACREPTEMVIEVTTDFDCSMLQPDAVGLRIGSEFPVLGPIATLSTACSQRRAGSVVVTPNPRGNGLVTIEVMAAVAPATLVDGVCDEGTPGCIHARRSLSFLSNVPLHVPITLQATCAGKGCGPTETCVDAQCVPANIDPSQCQIDCSLHTSDAGLQDGGDAGPPPANCGDMSGLLAGAAWPMDLYCPGHTGVSPFAGPSAAPQTTWRFRILGADAAIAPVPAAVAIDANDIAYVLGVDANLWAIDLMNKTSIWGPVAVQSGALNTNAGTVLLASDGKLYVGNDSQVISFDRATGSETGIRASAQNGSIRSTFATGTLGLYFSDPVSTIEAFSLGPPLAFVRGSANVGSIDNVNPTLFQNRVYVTNTVGDLRVVDDTLQTFLGSFGFLEPDGQGSTVAVGPDGKVRVLFRNTTDTRLASADAVTPSIAPWSVSLGPHASVQIAAVDAQGFTYVTDDNRQVHVVDKNGTVDPNPQAWLGAPAWPGFGSTGLVFTTDGAGTLIAKRADGNLVWTSTFVGNPWQIYIGTHDELLTVEDQDLVVYYP